MVRIFRHYIPKALLLLGKGEAAIFFGSVYVVVSFWFPSSNPIDKMMVGSLWSKAAAFGLRYQRIGKASLTDRLLLFGCLAELHIIDGDRMKTVVRDISEEHGGADDNEPAIGLSDSTNVTALSPPQGSTEGASESNNGTVDKLRQHDDPLKSMESTMVSLANVMKDELTLLRETMRQAVNSDQGKKN